MAEEAQEVEQNPLHDLVQHALDQDYNKANQVFGDAMTVKLNDVMDQEQIKLSSQIYNGVPEDEEQLNLDLGDEAEPEEDEESDEELEDNETDESDEETDESDDEPEEEQTS